MVCKKKKKGGGGPLPPWQKDYQFLTSFKIWVSPCSNQRAEVNSECRLVVLTLMFYIVTKEGYSTRQSNIVTLQQCSCHLQTLTQTFAQRHSRSATIYFFPLFTMTLYLANYPSFISLRISLQAFAICMSTLSRVS